MVPGLRKMRRFLLRSTIAVSVALHAGKEGGKVSCADLKRESVDGELYLLLCIQHRHRLPDPVRHLYEGEGMAFFFLTGRSHNLRLLHPAAERRQVDVVLLAELTLALPGLQKLLDLLHLELRGVRLVLLLTHGT